MIDKQDALEEFENGLVFGAVFKKRWDSTHDEEFLDVLTRSLEFRSGALAMRRAKADLLAAEHTRLDALQPDPPLIVSEFNLKPDAASYAGGARGTASICLRQAAQIIDVIIACRAKTFQIDHFLVDGQDMILGSTCIDADAWFEAAIPRGVRFTTLQARRWAVVEFRNHTTDPEKEPFAIKVKVRSRHKREELLPGPVE